MKVMMVMKRVISQSLKSELRVLEILLKSQSNSTNLPCMTILGILLDAEDNKIHNSQDTHHVIENTAIETNNFNSV